MRVVLVCTGYEENLALGYLRSALENAGHEVERIYFDREEDIGPAARELAAVGAPLAGFSMTFTHTAWQFAALATRARQLGFAGHLVMGGHFASFNAETLLRDVPAIDSVIRGEGEVTLVQLAACLDDLPAVPGLVFRSGAADIIVNPPASKTDDLDRLAWPRREPPHRYLGLGIVNFLGSRGCTFACTFCSISAWHRLCGGARHRMRSVTAIAEEMADLYARGVRIFNFQDDNFLPIGAGAALGRMQRLRAELGRLPVGRIAFSIKARPDEVDEELFGLMKSMGLFRVFLGIEAGTAQALKALHRGQTPRENERALEIVNRLDLHACFNLLLFHPDTTIEDFLANVAFLEAHPSNPMNFCRTEVYAGTPLEAMLRREGRLLGDYWGRYYEIRDLRAQQAFELIRTAFVGRNLPNESSVHRITLSVDFERQLLAHFYGDNMDLKRRVKRFIEDVNLDTCARLAAVGLRSSRGFGSESDLRAFEESLGREMSVINRTLLDRGNQLLTEIRSLGRETGRVHDGRGRLRRVAVAAGVAAALSLGGEAVARDEPYPCEPAPASLRPPTPVSADEMAYSALFPRFFPDEKRSGRIRVGLVYVQQWPEMFTLGWQRGFLLAPRPDAGAGEVTYLLGANGESPAVVYFKADPPAGIHVLEDSAVGRIASYGPSSPNPWGLKKQAHLVEVGVRRYLSDSLLHPIVEDLTILDGTAAYPIDPEATILSMKAMFEARIQGDGRIAALARQIEARKGDAWWSDHLEFSRMIYHPTWLEKEQRLRVVFLCMKVWKRPPQVPSGNRYDPDFIKSLVAGVEIAGIYEADAKGRIVQVQAVDPQIFPAN